MTDPELERSIEHAESVQADGLSFSAFADFSGLDLGVVLNWLRRLRLAERMLDKMQDLDGVVRQLDQCIGCGQPPYSNPEHISACEYVEWRKLREGAQDGE